MRSANTVGSIGVMNTPTLASALNGSRQPRSDADAQAQALTNLIWHLIKSAAEGFWPQLLRPQRDAGLWAKLKIATCSLSLNADIAYTGWAIAPDSANSVICRVMTNIVSADRPRP